MSVTQREWTFNVTGSWQEVMEIPSGNYLRHMIFDNYGNVEIEVAFSSTNFPDVTIPGKSSKVIDDDTFVGKVFVRRAGGIMNTVGRIRLW